METSLHRELKKHYARDTSQTEVQLGRFRIDAIDPQGNLVEVQHAGLGAIRNKLQVLLETHTVRVVKPVIQNKWLVKVDPATGATISRRRSPKRCTHIDLVGDLLHFTSIFPHKNLVLEVPLVDVEEVRESRPHHYRRKKQFRVLDQRLIAIHEQYILRTSNDLWLLIGQPTVPSTFDTSHLAVAMGRPRWFAQQCAYVLLHCGAIVQAGKRANNKLYQLAIQAPPELARKRRIKKQAA